MQVYLIVLQGQGDEYAAIVDKETWDWINSDVPEYAIGKSSWSERATMPQRVREAIDKANEADPEDPQMTCGSFDNDRAMHVCAYHAALYCDMGDEDETRREAKRWARENGHKIVDTYEGCIY